MMVFVATIPLVLYVLAVHFEALPPPKDKDGENINNAKARRWLFRVVTASLLTFQIGKRALDSWWGQLIFVASQLLLVEVTTFSSDSLTAFSRCLIPTQVGLIAIQGSAAIPYTFAIRTTSAMFRVTPSNLEHWFQLALFVPVVLVQLEDVNEASLTRLALYTSSAVLLPLAVDDIADSLFWLNERVMHTLIPKFELEFHNAPARWSVIGSFISFASVILAQLLELNSGTYYDLLWQIVSLGLLVGSVFTWGLTFCAPEANANAYSSSSSSQSKTLQAQTASQSSWAPEEKATTQPENVFLQRARHEDLMTFQAAMSFIHMLLVLFMTSIDLPHLAFVNLAVIAGLLFQEHTSASLHELVSGVVVAQALSLVALRHQLNDALSVARDMNPNAQLAGVDAIVEQVGLVYCSIRLVAGAILAENFSRHSAETLLLASVSVFCSSGYSTRYLCLVMSWMAMFAARIRASAWAVASAWLNSEAELRRFMDHELKVSFAGIMLALEHCLTDEGLGRLPDETVDMLKEALAECKRGKELCFEAAVQRLAYDNAYELRIEGKTLEKGLQTSYHAVEQVMSDADRVRVVYTDWNLVNHILDNAVANGAKYGSNLQMTSSITHIGNKDPRRGFRPATLRVRVTNTPTPTERYNALLQMPDKNILFEDTVISRVRNHMWTLGSGRNSTHLGLPVARLFATRLGGTVSLIAKPDLTTFALDVPVQIGPKLTDSLQDRAMGTNMSTEPSSSDVDTSYVASGASETLPPGLVFAVLDDSSMIRSTMALTLKRDFQASDRSIVVGATPEEAATFASKAKEIQADICIVDENLDYDIAGASMVGTKIVEELRSIGYDGVIVLYSANEKLELSLNWGLVDGFASKSANRLDTKKLLTRIYFDSLSRKQGDFVRRRARSPTGPARVGNQSSAEETPAEVSKAPVSLAASIPKVEAASGRYRIFFSSGVGLHSSAFGPAKDLSQFTKGYHIAIVPANSQVAAAIRSSDPNVSLVGILPPLSAGTPFTGTAYSPFVRFVAGLPAVDYNVSVEDLILFADGFDALVKGPTLEGFDPAILGELAQKQLLLQGRFFDGTPLNQDVDLALLNEFETADERNSMIDVMNEAITESLQRIYKRPTPDNVRKLAHLIKGASIQIGARALHKLAAKTERHCESDFDGKPSDVHRMFAQFFLLMVDYLRVARTYFK